MTDVGGFRSTEDNSTEDSDLNETTEQRVFADNGFRGGSLFYTAPSLVAAHTISNAYVHGSKPVRRRARIFGVLMIAMIVAPTLIGLAANLFLQ